MEPLAEAAEGRGEFTGLERDVVVEDVGEVGVFEVHLRLAALELEFGLGLEEQLVVEPPEEDRRERRFEDRAPP